MNLLVITHKKTDILEIILRSLFEKIDLGLRIIRGTVAELRPTDSAERVADFVIKILSFAGGAAGLGVSVSVGMGIYDRGVFYSEDLTKFS